jgi:hypothetical protein
MECILFDLAVLWIATLIFIDHNVQAAWKWHKIGRLTSRKIVSYVCWRLTFIIITSLSLTFLLWQSSLFSDQFLGQ